MKTALKTASQIWLENGQIQLQSVPGAPPLELVIPLSCPVQVTLAGQLLRGRVLLTGEERLSLSYPVTNPASVEPLISISADNMQVRLQVIKRPAVRYILEDTQPGTSLVLEARRAQAEMVYADWQESLVRALQDRGVRCDLDQAALEEAFYSGRMTTVACGISPEEPQDEDFIYLLADFAKAQPGPKEKINYYERCPFPIVKAGDLLLQKTPARPGRSGTNVFGKELPVRIPQTKTIREFPRGSVSQAADGSLVYAALAGIPSYDGGRIGVKVVCNIAGDASVNTSGNIDFPGSVLVHGQVEQGVHIWSGQHIWVKHNVERAFLQAREQIVLQGKVIQSRVMAGGEASLWLHVLPDLLAFCELLQIWLAGYREALQRMPHLAEISVQKILAALLPLLAPSLLAMTREIWDALQDAHLAAKDAMKFKRIAAMVLNIYREDPLQIAEMEQGLQELEQLLEQLQGLAQTSYDIRAPYILHSRLIASGHILIQEGSYHCQLKAGGDVLFQACGSYFRDGLIQAQGQVSVSELGSPNGCLTRVEVPAGSCIKAERVFPGVSIQIGEAEHHFIEEQLNLCAHLDKEGELQLW